MAALQAYDWPGNVRQLRNVVELAADHGAGRARAADPRRHAAARDRRDAPTTLQSRTGGEIMVHAAARGARAVRARSTSGADQRFGGNISRTADFVGMERSALHRKLKTPGHRGSDRLQSRTSGTESPPAAQSHEGHRLRRRPGRLQHRALPREPRTTTSPSSTIARELIAEDRRHARHPGDGRLRLASRRAGAGRRRRRRHADRGHAGRRGQHGRLPGRALAVQRADQDRARPPPGLSATRLVATCSAASTCRSTSSSRPRSRWRARSPGGSRCPGAFDMIPLADGRVALIGVHCARDCPILDTPLRQLTGLFPDLNIVVVGDRPQRPAASCPSRTTRCCPATRSTSSPRPATSPAPWPPSATRSRRRGASSSSAAAISACSSPQELEREHRSVSAQADRGRPSARAECGGAAPDPHRGLHGDVLDPEILEEANVGQRRPSSRSPTTTRSTSSPRCWPSATAASARSP